MQETIAAIDRKERAGLSYSAPPATFVIDLGKVLAYEALLDTSFLRYRERILAC
jgi:hypothetical protein